MPALERKMASLTTHEARLRRHRRVRGKVRGTAERPRLAIFRSNRGIFAHQIGHRAFADVLAHVVKHADLYRPLGGRPAGPLSAADACP